MGLQKGQTNNAGGRPKGTPNKTTKDLREWLTAFVEGNTDQIEQDWKKLKPQERITLFEKLMKYTLPQLQSVSTTIIVEQPTPEDEV